MERGYLGPLYPTQLQAWGPEGTLLFSCSDCRPQCQGKSFNKHLFNNMNTDIETLDEQAASVRYPGRHAIECILIYQGCHQDPSYSRSTQSRVVSYQ